MQNTMTQEELFKKLVAHCKEYGFIFLPAKYTTDWVPCTITGRTASS